MRLLPRSCWGCQAWLAHPPPPLQICRECALGIEPLEAVPQRASAGMLSLYVYQGVAASLLSQLKHQGSRRAAAPLGELWWQAPANPLRLDQADQSFDALVPIPLHPLRRLARGYNQCEEILHWAARAARRSQGLRLPSMLRLLKRRRHTAPQQELGKEARLANLKDAFDARPADPGQANLRILVCDDVHTTGATLSQALSALERAGYRHCQGLSLLRADSYDGS